MENLEIRIQGTPNPNALKYILNKDVKHDGKVSFTDALECPNVPLATALLEVENVSQVHFFENVLTVTQNGRDNWYELDVKIRSVLHEQMPVHDATFVVEQEKRREHQDPTLQSLEEILDRTIRPGLQADGGDVQLVSFDTETNKLLIHYEGACGSCPSSTAGTLHAIEGILRDEFNPDISIDAV